MILFPWLARVFDRHDGRTHIQEIRAQSVTYYQALIDNRDMPYVRAQTGSPILISFSVHSSDLRLESVTFLGHEQRDRNLYAIPGLDYVAHEDVIPYTVIALLRLSYLIEMKEKEALPKHLLMNQVHQEKGLTDFFFFFVFLLIQSTERTPIEHELFDKFLLHDPDASRSPPIRRLELVRRFLAPNFVSRENLKSWQDRHHRWLELSDVSKDVTHQIRVTVIPFYM